MANDIIVFSGGDVITPKRLVKADLVVQDSKIKEIREPQPLLPGEKQVDCTGCYVGPGLVDIHVHGGQGYDFVSQDPQEIANAADYHLSQGITSLLVTIMSVPFDDLRLSVEATKEAVKICRNDILGMHVEGIYLDQEFRGGHLTDYVHDPDPNEYMPLIEQHGDFIREWTLAPELPGSLELITTCAREGIVASAGHTQATYAQMMSAIEAGLTHGTHFTCCMGSLRFEALGPTTGKGFAPGVLETVLLCDEVTTEVICDGFHVHPGYVHLAFKCKGPDGLCLISDTVKSVGLPDGEYPLAGQISVKKNGIAIIKDRPEIISSSVTDLADMMRKAHRNMGISLVDAWTMASLTPARVIGVENRKGSLAPGKDADLLILDKNLQTRDVYTRGQKVPTSPSP